MKKQTTPGPKMKKSFKQWCDENKRQDLLDRWDYEKNTLSPEEVSYASGKKIYFKCPKGVHESEPRKVCVITCGTQKNFYCNECNKIWNAQIDDLTGKQFGQLTVLELDKDRNKKSKQTYWKCKCSCGATVSVGASALKDGVQVTCGNRSIHWSGENAPNWKGGVTPENIALRNSDSYNEWRKAVFEKDGYKCLVCGCNKKLEAHHIYPFASYTNDRFRVKSGATLCYWHHSMYEDGSFHKEYGTHNNTPEQLEEYINRKRQALGITESFDIYKFMSSIEDDDMEIDDYGLDL